MAGTIYTVGYVTTDPETLAATAQQLNAVVIDTRFSPRSRQPQWAGENVRQAMGIGRYEHLKALGNKNYKGGPIDFVDLLAGQERIANILHSGRNVILMCACGDVNKCHRKVAAEHIAEALKVQVQHIYPGKAEPAVNLKESAPVEPSAKQERLL